MFFGGAELLEYISGIDIDILSKVEDAYYTTGFRGQFQPFGQKD